MITGWVIGKFIWYIPNIIRVETHCWENALRTSQQYGGSRTFSLGAVRGLSASEQ